LLLVMISFWLRLQILTALAAVFQWRPCWLLGSLGGNLLSILYPFASRRLDEADQDARAGDAGDA